MNVSSLTLWLSDFHTDWFSGSSGYFFVFKFVVVLLLVVRGGKVYLPMPPSWPEVQNHKLSLICYSFLSYVWLTFHCVRCCTRWLRHVFCPWIALSCNSLSWKHNDFLIKMIQCDWINYIFFLKSKLFVFISCLKDTNKSFSIYPTSFPVFFFFSLREKKDYAIRSPLTFC